MSRFDFIVYDETSIHLSSQFKSLYEKIEACTNSLSDSSEKKALLQHLEESFMWVGKAIRSSQICRHAVGTGEETNS